MRRMLAVMPAKSRPEPPPSSGDSELSCVAAAGGPGLLAGAAALNGLLNWLLLPGVVRDEALPPQLWSSLALPPDQLLPSWAAGQLPPELPDLRLLNCRGVAASGVAASDHLGTAAVLRAVMKASSNLLLARRSCVPAAALGAGAELFTLPHRSSSAGVAYSVTAG
jgi:hypothetical protein